MSRRLLIGMRFSVAHARCNASSIRGQKTSSTLPMPSTSTQQVAAHGSSPAAGCRLGVIDPHALSDRLLVVVRRVPRSRRASTAAAPRRRCRLSGRSPGSSRGASRARRAVSSRASAWASVRGKPSSTKPFLASGSARRSAGHGRSRSRRRPACPISMTALACSPSSVPGRHRRPQHVAGRDVRNAQALDQARGLRPLAGTRGGPSSTIRVALIGPTFRESGRPSRSRRIAATPDGTRPGPIVSSATPTQISSAVPPK